MRKKDVNGNNERDTGEPGVPDVSVSNESDVVRTDAQGRWSYISALYERLMSTPQEPAKPEPSSHLWTADLPGGLRPGPHTLTVRSTDPYG